MLYALITTYETTHGFRYAWVVRLRPDLWFFADGPSHYSLRMHAAFPAGVMVCSAPATAMAPHDGSTSSGPMHNRSSRVSPACENDHIAWVPRAHAASYFETAHDLERCAQGKLQLYNAFLKNDRSGSYVASRVNRLRLPIISPSPLVPYTLMRPCNHSSTHDSGSSTARSTLKMAVPPQCYRWRINGTRGTGWPPLSVDQLAATHRVCLERWEQVHSTHAGARELNRMARTCHAIDTNVTISSKSILRQLLRL